MTDEHCSPQPPSHSSIRQMSQHQSEIAVVEEHHADDAGSDEAPDVSESYLQKPSVIDGKKDCHKDDCEYGSDGDNVHRYQVQGIEASYKDSDASPAGPCQQDKEDAQWTAVCVCVSTIVIH